MMRLLLLLFVLVSLHSPLIHGQDEDTVVVVNVTGGVTPGGASWLDSYSVDNYCYCKSSFDHNIGNYFVETPYGWFTARQVCELLGQGPGSKDRPQYNDVQCGNGPPNDAGDEHVCPGRVDIGEEGCGHIGPKWNFENVTTAMLPQTSSTEPPSDAHPDIVAVLNVTGGIMPNSTMASSYSVGGKCYCVALFYLSDQIQSFYVETPLGWMTVAEVCTLVGEAPDKTGEEPVLYNDVQCGHGPPSSTGGEHDCPGRVDIGQEGCGHIGPRWDFSAFTTSPPSSSPTTTTTIAPTALSTTPAPTTSAGYGLQVSPLLLVGMVSLSFVMSILTFR